VKQINKKDSAVLTDNHNDLIANTEKYNNLITELNSRIQAVFNEFVEQNESQLVGLETDIQSTADNLEKLSLAQVQKMEDYISERSEKWHDTDSGLNFTEWKDDWEEFANDVVRTPDFDCFSGIEIQLEEKLKIPKFNR